MPGVLAGAFLAFMTSFDNVIVSLFLRIAGTYMLPIRMWQDVEGQLDVRIAAVSGLLICATIVLMLLMERVAGFPDGPVDTVFPKFAAFVRCSGEPDLPVEVYAADRSIEPTGGRCPVNLIIIVVILLLLFGGGGFYYGGPYVGGGLGTILLIVLIVLLLR